MNKKRKGSSFLNFNFLSFSSHKVMKQIRSCQVKSVNSNDSLCHVLFQSLCRAELRRNRRKRHESWIMNHELWIMSSLKMYFHFSSIDVELKMNFLSILRHIGTFVTSKLGTLMPDCPKRGATGRSQNQVVCFCDWLRRAASEIVFHQSEALRKTDGEWADRRWQVDYEWVCQAAKKQQVRPAERRIQTNPKKARLKFFRQESQIQSDFYTERQVCVEPSSFTW